VIKSKTCSDDFPKLDLAAQQSRNFCLNDLRNSSLRNLRQRAANSETCPFSGLLQSVLMTKVHSDSRLVGIPLGCDETTRRYGI
jgi:hypothetical protein